MNKYVLTDETIIFDNHTLHRIQALVDIPMMRVKAGDLGGYIESEENLSQTGSCYVFGDAKVMGEAKVRDNARIWGSAKVYGHAEVSEHAKVYGRAAVFGNTKIYGYAMIHADAKVYGRAEVYENAEVLGNARVYDYANVFGHSIIHNFSEVFCDANVFGLSAVFNQAKIGSHAYLTTNKDYICIGPIGSRSDCTTFYKDISGCIWVSCGCFNDSISAFRDQVTETHKGKRYEMEYLFASEFAERYLTLK